MKSINTSTFDFPTLLQKGCAYVFKFKFGKSAKAAIEQCRDRNYAAAFADDPRPVFYVGVNYSPRKNIRTVNDVKCENAG